MESNVLVDSNVIIKLLKHKQDPARVLLKWIGNGELLTCGIVQVEVLRGVISPKSHRHISSFMDALLNVPSDQQLWQDATDLAWKLDRSGWIIPTTDLIIAASAMRAGAAVMTSDAHFSRIEGLRVIAPPAEWFA